MLTQTQIANRRIGGSKSSVIMGLNQYRTRFEQYQIDIGELEEENLDDNYHVICGNRIEEPLRRVMESRGVVINVRKEQFFHPKYKWYSANIDGYRGDTVVELKSALNWLMDKSFGDDGTDDIPLSYNLQVQHYLLSPEYKHAELHAVFLPDEMKRAIANIDFTMEQLTNICEEFPIRSYNIEPDFMLVDDYIAEAEYYWDCVQTKTVPRLITAKEVTQRYLESNGKSIPASDEDLRNYTALQMAKSDEKIAKAKIKGLKDKLAVSYGENEIMIYNGDKIGSYKTQETRRLDTKRIKEAGLYDEYSTVSLSRVFR